MRKLVLNVLGNILGYLIPRGGGNPDAPGSAGEDIEQLIARAKQLEDENARIKETLEQEAQARAERLVLDLYPEFAQEMPSVEAPDPTPQRRPVQGEEDPRRGSQDAADMAAAVDPRRIDHLERELYEMQVNTQMVALDTQLNQLQERFPEMDRVRILGEMARSGADNTNLERLAELSHNVNSRLFEEKYAARRARETAPEIPPPSLGRPAATPVTAGQGPRGGEAATRRFIELAQTRGFKST